VGASPDAAVEPKARILDAAAEDFMRHGFADTTVDDIADAVGATKGLQRPSSRRGGPPPGLLATGSVSPRRRGHSALLRPQSRPKLMAFAWPVRYSARASDQRGLRDGPVSGVSVLKSDLLPPRISQWSF
jgi:hypothetical protein